MYICIYFFVVLYRDEMFLEAIFSWPVLLYFIQYSQISVISFCFRTSCLESFQDSYLPDYDDSWLFSMVLTFLYCICYLFSSLCLILSCDLCQSSPPTCCQWLLLCPGWSNNLHQPSTVQLLLRMWIVTLVMCSVWQC